MSKSWPLEVLNETEREAIMYSARQLLPRAVVTALPLDLQGFCSYTLAVSLSPSDSGRAAHIVQFRPKRFSLNFDRVKDLTSVYGSYAPGIEDLGNHTIIGIGELQVSLSTAIFGAPYSILQPRHVNLTHMETTRLKRILSSFADFLVRGFQHAVKQVRKETCNGRVGSTVSTRIKMLSQSLPSPTLRDFAKHVLHRLHLLDGLPVVLTHGDVLPANVIINAATDSIEGFIDWAEAEYLPFGLCLYGLEHFLGFNRSDESAFVYYSSATDLRRHFWEELIKRVPELQDERFERRVRLARDVGVLLWFGFAWDDGAINRVINARDDAVELMQLRAFLGADSSSKLSHDRTTVRGRGSRM